MRSEQQQLSRNQNASIKKANRLFWRMILPSLLLMQVFQILNVIIHPDIFIWQLRIFTWLETLAFLLFIVGLVISLGLLIKGRHQIAKEREGKQ